MSNFSRSSASRPARRLLPHALRRGAQLRRLRGDTGRAEVARPFRPQRAFRLLAPLILVALLVIVGRRYVMQQVDIEGRIRHEVIPSLEKQYNTHIEVGRIESDWLSQVTLHDIVVGRDPTIPLGALFQTKSAVVNLNIIDLALQRADVLGALRSVILEGPQLYVARDAQGQLNLSRLFKSNTTTSTSRWTGFVQVNRGRLWYHDLRVRSASGQPLLVDAWGAQGRLQFNGSDPPDFNLRAARSLVGPARTPIQNVILQGTIGLNGRWLALDAAWPTAPAALLTDYAFPKRDIVAEAGAIGGSVQIGWDGGLPLASQTTVAGNLASRDVNGYIASVKEPNTNHPLTIAQLTGPVTFNNHALALNGVSLVALNTPMRVSGNVALLRQAVFDLTLQSKAADTNRLIALWHGPLPGGISMSGGSAGVNLRAAGTLQAARLDGDISIPNFKFQQPRYGLVTTPRLDSVIHATGNLQAATLNAAIQSSTVNATLPQYGQVSMSALRGTARLNGNLRAPHLQADLQGTDVGVSSTDYGRWHAASLHGLVNATGDFQTENINAEISGAALYATHPQYGIWNAGGLHGLVQASGNLQDPAISSDVTLTNFAGREARYGAVRGAALHLLADTPNLATAAWHGETSLSNVDVAQINLNALSPAVAQQAHGLGVVSGRARFTGLQAGGQPIIKGNFQLSQATVADVALHDVNAAASFAGGRLRVAGARAQSDLGPLIADLDSDLLTHTTKLALTAPRTVIEAQRLNPYLARQGFVARGQAVGRLTVATTNRPLPATLKRGLLRGQVALDETAPTTLETSFDFALPTATLRGTGQRGWGRRAIKAQTARLQGRGAVEFNSVKNWRFVGDANLTASRADWGGAGNISASWQDRLNGSRLEGILLTARGSLSSRAGQIEPHFAGNAQIGRGVLPLVALPDAKAVATSGLGPVAHQWALARDINLDYVAQPGDYVVPRVFARFARGAVNGHGELKGNLVAGQLLAERLDVAQLQQWVAALAPESGTEKFKAQGLAYARADLTGTTANPQATVQARLYNGTVQLSDAVVPIDMARASFTLQPADLSVVELPELTIWSNGGRLAAHGTLTQQAGTYSLDLRAALQDVRARDVALTPGLRSLSETAGLQALLGGDLHILGSLAKPRLEGEVGVKLARAYGLSIEDAKGQLTYDGTAPQPTIQLANLTGHTDGQPFTGALNVDYGAGTWSAKLNTQGANAARLLQVAATNSDVTTAKNLAGVPLRGTIAADVDVQGTIHSTPDATRFVPQTGIIKLQSGTLLWRGRHAGTLTADLTLTDGLLHASKIELRRAKSSISGPDDALVEVSGALPTDAETPNLDTQITVSNEQLSAVLTLLTEAQRTLRDEGQRIAWLDRLIQSEASWPAGLEGNIAVDTRVTGSWRNPFFAVHLASLSNTHAQSDYGRTQPLPTVDAAFTYSQGAMTIQRAELRLAKNTTNMASATADSEASDDDTMLRIAEGGRIVPGGEISLDAEVLNANLSQLATWVPSLRAIDGAPALSGVLSQFSFQVGGTTDDPTVTGSITASDLVYHNYTLNRLRVSRFDIANGQLAIRPGNLTLVKGDFQSSAASGFISWSWTTPGPRMDGPLEVHLPLQRADFGALAGIFVPAITSVDAKAFSGVVDVTGTIEAPVLGGAMSIDDGRFRLNSPTTSVDGGIVGLSGGLKFVNGNQIQIDPNNILRGQFVPGARVAALALTTGNDEPTDVVPTPKGSKRRPRPTPTPVPTTPVNMTGDFTLRGDVALNLDPAILARPLETLGEHRYNLAATLDKANLGTDAFSGLRNVSLGLLWRTGAGEAATSQHLEAMLAANGQGAKKKDAGSVYALAGMTLAPNFATGADALLRSQVTTFDDAGAFKDFPVYRRLTAAAIENRSSRLVCQTFGFNARDMGSGILDGALYLDNQATAPRVLPPLNRVAGHSSIATRLAALRLAGLSAGPLTTTTPQQGATDANADNSQHSDAKSQPPRIAQTNGGQGPPVPPTPDVAPADAPFVAGTLPIRVSGILTLTQTQLTGLPASAPGGTFVLPDAPRLDVRLALGRSVAFQTSTLRTDLAGTLNVEGTPHDPQIRGTILTRNGEVRFPNAVARITTGEITVDAARDPVSDAIRSSADIDATALGRVGQYQITLTLRGPLDFGSENIQNLRVDITSNPPLSQDEAFAQLLGTSLRDLQNGDPEALRSGQVNQTYARAVVNLISAPLFTGLERSIEKALGINSVVLDYRLDEPLSVEFGKALGDRVYVTYRRSLANNDSGQTTPFTLRIDYRIKGNLQLGLQTNERQQRQITLGKTWRF